jgi:hypothetical protein
MAEKLIGKRTWIWGSTRVSPRLPIRPSAIPSGGLRLARATMKIIDCSWVLSGLSRLSSYDKSQSPMNYVLIFGQPDHNSAAISQLFQFLHRLLTIIPRRSKTQWSSAFVRIAKRREISGSSLHYDLRSPRGSEMGHSVDYFSAIFYEPDWCSSTANVS